MAVQISLFQCESKTATSSLVPLAFLVLQLGRVGEDEHFIVWPRDDRTAAQKEGHQRVLAAACCRGSCSGESTCCQHCLQIGADVLVE